MWFCYILKNENNKSTYNGSTNNPIRRLRQHSGAIKGGASATSRVPGIWSYIAILSGHPDHINALQSEWRIKCCTGKPGKRPKEYEGPIGRIKSLNLILPLEYWTKQSTICNRDFKMKLLILEDMVQYLDKSLIPENIEVITTSKIEDEIEHLTTTAEMYEQNLT